MAEPVPFKIIENSNAFAIQWTLTNSDTDGDWYVFPSYGDKTYHVFGTFSGGTVTFEGSNENVASPTSVFNCKDSDHNEISVTAANGAGLILESPIRMRPKLTGGSGQTITVVITGRRG